MTDDPIMTLTETYDVLKNEQDRITLRLREIKDEMRLAVEAAHSLGCYRKDIERVTGLSRQRVHEIVRDFDYNQRVAIERERTAEWVAGVLSRKAPLEKVPVDDEDDLTPEQLAEILAENARLLAEADEASQSDELIQEP